MSIKPLVSVITIFLNEEKFIEEAIASVFTQTYNHWELLLVDDGPTDKSTEIAKRYKECFSLYKVTGSVSDFPSLDSMACS